ncbi:hypothetical protein [Microcoleus sp. AT8-B5]
MFPQNQVLYMGDRPLARLPSSLTINITPKSTHEDDRTQSIDIPRAIG